MSDTERPPPTQPTTDTDQERAAELEKALRRAARGRRGTDGPEIAADDAGASALAEED